MAALGLCLAGMAQAQPAPTPELETLASRAASDGAVKVIVRLGLPTRNDAQLSDEERRQQRLSISTAQSNLLAQVLGTAQARVKHRFETVPFMAMEVDANALSLLRISPMVSQISEDKAEPPTMLQSNPLINAPTAWARGYTGTGWAVAVLDTGVDKTHAFLSGKVVSEACYSSTVTTGSFPSNSVCPGGASSSTAVGSGVPCVGSGDCQHGTRVAGTAAGGLRVADGSRGVAHGASVIAVQVFSLFPNFNGGGVTRALTWSSDKMSALERVYALRSTYNIAAVNMSLGGGASSGNCDADPRKPIIDNLRAAGIATVVSAGNDGFTGAMGAPACISSAISVAASCDASSSITCATGVNGLASYSNVSSVTSLAAPGSFITSSVPGGGYEAWNGTSMAAPHVAGAWALYRQWKPADTVTTALAAFKTNGLTINDTRPGGTVTGLKRIDLAFIGAGTNYTLTVSKGGAAAASGVVTSSPAGISCGSDCSEAYSSGTSVTLTASAPSGTLFSGWGGACAGTAATCTVTMDAAKTVSASFASVPVSTYQFSATGYSVTEGTASVVITVTRSSGASAGSVAYATANGSALAGSDYTSKTGTLAFAAGVLSRTFSVPIKNDTVVEATESFTVSLSAPVGGSLGSPSSATVTVADNDTAAGSVFKLGAATFSGTEAGGVATIRVTRTVTAAPASVRYATSNGTAAAGSDYTATSGVLSFPAGVSVLTFMVPIINDTAVEGPETFNVSLNTPTGGTIGTPASAVVTIVDNDLPPVLQFGLAAYRVNEGAGTVTLTVTRSSGEGTSSVSFASSNGTATAGSDYTARSGVLSFAAGETSKTLVFVIREDTAKEANETFQVALSSVVGATLGTRTVTTVTILDND
ncbi:MAG: Calx-beta domain-containing protein [Rubrivivax sp.]